MKRMIISILLAICAGCSTYKSEESKGGSRRGIVSVTINIDGDQYEAKAKWVEINQANAEDVVAEAGTTSLLNSWSCAKVIDATSEYSSKVTILLDNEIVEVSNGYGTTFGVMAKKQDGKIYAKGIFAVTTRDQNISCSFEGYFKPGEPQNVYVRSEFWGKDSAEPIEHGPFKPIEGGIPLFK